MSISVYQNSDATQMKGKASNSSQHGDKFESRVIYPDVAQSWIKNCVWERQRPVRMDRVKFYAKMMSNGEWIDNSELRFVRYGDNLHLINGRHRLMGLIESQTPQRFLIHETVVSRESDIAEIYASIDRGLGRTPYDQLHALGTDALYGWNNMQLNMLVPAVKLISTEFHPHRAVEFTTAETQALVDKYASSFDTYLEWGTNAPDYIRRAPLKRRATVGVALVTILQSSARYGIEKVREFWIGALTDDGITIGDARKVAHRHLVGTGMEGGGETSAKRMVSAPYSARYLANCFNAWTENRSLTFTRVDESVSIKINGSLFTGK